MKKISISIKGHRTSLSLEPEFMDELQRAADLKKVPLAKIICDIDEGRGAVNLSSAVRVFLLRQALRKKA
ncbi:MAG: ribbon-helix-helix domain-containing protein [Rickettsiales bacterium]|jgi:predicted DNA-binding ribbon-helix-helix protein|nr:ribbon-helix-helix domain-containing protein [Rickettsiales bacterium]